MTKIENNHSFWDLEIPWRKTRRKAIHEWKGISRRSCAGVRVSVWRRKFSIFRRHFPPLLDRNLAQHLFFVGVATINSRCLRPKAALLTSKTLPNTNWIFFHRSLRQRWTSNERGEAETKIALQTFRKLRKSASFKRDNWVIRREQFVNYSIHSLSLLSDNGFEQQAPNTIFLSASHF